MTRDVPTRLPPTFEYVVGLTLERLLRLVRPGDEPSPFAGGGTAAEWAEAAGLTGQTPHPAIRGWYGVPFNVAPYEPSTVAHTALQRLCARAEVERMAGVPMVYRAGRKARRRRRRRGI